jgi:putative ABC transport system permease protein
VGHGMASRIDGEIIQMRLLECDNEFVEVMGLEMASGRSFSSEDNADYERSCMINEAAVRKFGWEDPYAIRPWGMKIVGIVKDFNFESLHLPVAPLFMPFYGGMDKMAIRISASNQTTVIENIEKAWIKQYPEVPFNYEYVDQIIDKQYKDEERLGKVVTYFSVFALMIACLGLLGMTSFMIQQRNREIGIRRVYGGAVKQIVSMLSFEFVKWVFIAFVISVPISFYLMKTWLDRNFISHVELDWWIFVISGSVVVALSLITVSIQAYRAAVMNPVDSLRYE